MEFTKVKAKDVESIITPSKKKELESKSTPKKKIAMFTALTSNPKKKYYATTKGKSRFYVYKGYKKFSGKSTVKMEDVISIEIEKKILKKK